jgi:hypothetical protein
MPQQVFPVFSLVDLVSSIGMAEYQNQPEWKEMLHEPRFPIVGLSRNGQVRHPVALGVMQQIFKLLQDLRLACEYGIQLSI